MTDQDADASEWSAARPARRAGWPSSIVGTFVLVAMAGMLAWAASDRSSARTDEPVGLCRALLQGRECPVFSLAWSPDGRRLAVSGFGSNVRIWDRESGEVRTISGEGESPRFVIGWSDDGRRVVTGGLEVPVEAWDVDSGDFPEGGRKITRPADREPGLRMIVEASRGGPIRVRGPIEWRAAWLPASDHPALSAAFSPDGRSIVTADADQAVRIWDARTGQLRHTLQVDWRGTSCVAFSPDGSKIASGGGGMLRVWNADSGTLLKTVGGSIAGSTVVAFSPDGKRLAGATWDGDIRVWDVATGLERAKFGGHDGRVLSLAWSPDGRTLASGGYDSTVKLWDVSSPVDVARAR